MLLKAGFLCLHRWPKNHKTAPQLSIASAIICITGNGCSPITGNVTAEAINAVAGTASFMLINPKSVLPHPIMRYMTIALVTLTTV